MLYTGGHESAFVPHVPDIILDYLISSSEETIPLSKPQTVYPLKAN